MEPIDVCVHDDRYVLWMHRNDRSPVFRLRIPAAYLTWEFRDQNGLLGSVWLEFSLPDYQPTSPVPELKTYASPEERSQYFREQYKNRLRIEITGQIRTKRTFDTIERSFYAKKEHRVFPERFDLEHYRSYQLDAYFGYSAFTDDVVLITCQGGCTLNTRFRARHVKIKFSELDLYRWKEFDGHMHHFMSKYVVSETVKTPKRICIEHGAWLGCHFSSEEFDDN